MSKIIIWGICGVLIYLWLRKKMGLDKTEDKTTIHHHHYSGKKGKKTPQKSDEDYIDYEDVK